MPFTFTETLLVDAYIAEPAVMSDDRGFFYRTFCKEEFKGIAAPKEWVQINHSFTNKTGTIRGMHFQYPPHAETKLVRCIAGKVWDVIIDLRYGSATFLKWFGTELSPENRKMIFIPEGFAHGFQALADNSELIYHHSDFYVKEAEGGIRWDDPLINIKWPLPAINISGRDLAHPLITKQFSGIKL